MADITTSSKLAKTENAVWGEVDGELFITNASSGRYHCLNQTGAFIWKLLDQPQTVDEIVQTLLNHFEVDQETANTEVISFAQAMIDRDNLREV